MDPVFRSPHTCCREPHHRSLHPRFHCFPELRLRSRCRSPALLAGEQQQQGLLAHFPRLTLPRPVSSGADFLLPPNARALRALKKPSSSPPPLVSSLRGYRSPPMERCHERLEPRSTQPPDDYSPRSWCRGCSG